MVLEHANAHCGGGTGPARGLTWENGDRSGLVPEAMVASLHTMRKETTPRQQAMPRVTQGCAVHLRQQHHPHGCAHSYWVPLGQ